MSDKIKPQHLERKAILYIRQSSVYQVNHNLESQKLQYAMEERLQQLGWREVEVVDDDLGRSAAGTVTRAGFERMVAEVCLGKVGAVAAREVSRFARNSREWQPLIEVCRVAIGPDIPYQFKPIKISRPKELDWSNARGVYFSPDDPRLVRFDWLIANAVR